MREAVKVIAAIVFALSAIATLAALTKLFTDSISPTETKSAILGAAVASLLLSGAVWLLADIAQSVRKQR